MFIYSHVFSLINWSLINSKNAPSHEWGLLIVYIMA